MLPFLRVKRQQALDCLDFIDQIKNPNLGRTMIDKIIHLRIAGHSINVIGEILHLHRQTVKNILVKHTDYKSLKQKQHGHKDNALLVIQDTVV